MGQANPEMVAIGGDEHLRLVALAAEGDRMDDAVAIALKGVALSARRPVAFSVGPTARSRRVRGKSGRQAHLLESFSILMVAGVRVQLKPSTPSLASELTKLCAAPLLSNGPTSRRK